MVAFRSSCDIVLSNAHGKQTHGSTWSMTHPSSEQSVHPSMAIHRRYSYHTRQGVRGAQHSAAPHTQSPRSFVQSWFTETTQHDQHTGRLRRTHKACWARLLTGELPGARPSSLTMSAHPHDSSRQQKKGTCQCVFSAPQLAISISNASTSTCAFKPPLSKPPPGEGARAVVAVWMSARRRASIASGPSSTSTDFGDAGSRTVEVEEEAPKGVTEGGVGGRRGGGEEEVEEGGRRMKEGRC